MLITEKKEQFECQCQSCKSACTHNPGWFLPNEAEKAADYLGMSLQEFFNRYLGVNWWVDDPDIFVLAPALVGEETGAEYPGDPRGTCVFFNQDGLCDIHIVKPYECAELNCNKKKDTDPHEMARTKWKDHQGQIIELLGREPEAVPFFGDFFLKKCLMNYM